VPIPRVQSVSHVSIASHHTSPHTSHVPRPNVPDAAQVPASRGKRPEPEQRPVEWDKPGTCVARTGRIGPALCHSREDDRRDVLTRQHVLSVPLRAEQSVRPPPPRPDSHRGEENHTQNSDKPLRMHNVPKHMQPSVYDPILSNILVTLSVSTELVASFFSSSRLRRPSRRTDTSGTACRTFVPKWSREAEICAPAANVHGLGYLRRSGHDQR
jgi:hypothetical protein